MMKNQLDVQQENNEVMNSWFFHTNKYLFRLTLKEKPKAANVPLNNIGLFSFLFKNYQKSALSNQCRNDFISLCKVRNEESKFIWPFLIWLVDLSKICYQKWIIWMVELSVKNIFNACTPYTTFVQFI